MNTKNYLTNLPKELLEKIYYEKHKKEFLDIHGELLEYYDDMVYDIKCMLMYLKYSREYDERKEFNEKRIILNIYNAMYNENYMSKRQFHVASIDVINSMSGVVYLGEVDFYLDYNTKYTWCYDDSISFRQIIFENESIIGKSRRLKDDSDEWVKNNVR